MAYHATVDLLVHLDQFKNIELYHRGLYYVSVTCKHAYRDGIGTPYATFSEPPTLDGSVGRQVVEHEAHEALREGRLLDDGSGYLSRIFPIRYRDETVALNEGVHFQLRAVSDDCESEAEIRVGLFYCAFEKTKSMLLADLVPEKRTFDEVARQTVRVRDICNGVHGFFPVTFDDCHFAELGMSVHALLTNLRFQSAADEKGKQRRDDNPHVAAAAFLFPAARRAAGSADPAPHRDPGRDPGRDPDPARCGGAEGASYVHRSWEGVAMAGQVLQAQYLLPLLLSHSFAVASLRWARGLLPPGEADASGLGAALDSEGALEEPAEVGEIRRRVSANGLYNDADSVTALLGLGRWPVRVDGSAGEGEGDAKDFEDEKCSEERRTPLEVARQLAKDLHVLAQCCFVAWTRFATIIPFLRGASCEVLRRRWRRETVSALCQRVATHACRSKALLTPRSPEDLEKLCADLRRRIGGSGAAPPAVYDAALWDGAAEPRKLPVLIAEQYLNTEAFQKLTARLTDRGGAALKDSRADGYRNGPVVLASPRHGALLSGAEAPPAATLTALQSELELEAADEAEAVEGDAPVVRSTFQSTFLLDAAALANPFNLWAAVTGDAGSAPPSPAEAAPAPPSAPVGAVPPRERRPLAAPGLPGAEGPDPGAYSAPNGGGPDGPDGPDGPGPLTHARRCRGPAVPPARRRCASDEEGSEDAGSEDASSTSTSDAGRASVRRNPTQLWRRGGLFFEGLASDAGAKTRAEVESDTGRRHVIFVVHGYQGSAYDMRFLCNRLKVLLPDAVVIASRANESLTEAPLEEMGERLAREVRGALLERAPWLAGGSRGGRLSFVGHSIGSLIVRCAIKSPLLRLFLGRLHCLVSLNSPHLGQMFSRSQIVTGGMWALSMLRGRADVLTELRLMDGAEKERCALLRLSEEASIAAFRHVALVGSHQDDYVPLHSARVQVCEEAEAEGGEGHLLIRMAANIVGRCDAGSVVRLNVEHDYSDDKQSTIDSLIGRAAHIAYLDRPEVVDVLLAACLPLLC